MPSETYVALGSVTLSSAQTQVTFSNIPQIYTDLVIVVEGAGSTGGDLQFTFNADARTNYSTTWIAGNGTAASSARHSNYAYGEANRWESVTTTLGATAHIFSVMNYSNSTTFKTTLIRGNSAATGTSGLVSLYRSTAAITSMTLFLSSGNFSTGSTFNLYGVGANQLKASGGDVIQTDGTYWYHAFKTSGTFTPNSTLSCDVLVVGGGGGGGKDAGGGGGAGGIFYATSQSISTAQTITVGAGGAGDATTASPAASGGNSTFGSLTTGLGGGGGATGAGANGGSGGGAGRADGAASTSTQTGTGGTGYGFAGGSVTSTGNAGAGGGGAGAAGTSLTSGDVGKEGGIGKDTWSQWLSITGLSLPNPQAGYIAGGGGGGGNSALAGMGGYGGGGHGGSQSLAYGVPGLANTGGGGGGSSGGSGGRVGANGGSGLVIVRYAV